MYSYSYNINVAGEEQDKCLHLHDTVATVGTTRDVGEFLVYLSRNGWILKVQSVERRPDGQVEMVVGLYK